MRASQRSRLLAAMVAVVAERGYKRASVAPVLELSGVSRAAFYRLFESRGDCLAAAIEETIGMAVTRVERARRRASSPSERLLSGLEALLRAVAEQPAAAAACLVDVYEAGPEAIARAEQAKALFGPIYAGDLGDLGLPQSPLLGRAISGGIGKVVSTRLRQGRAAELPALAPALADWAVSYAGVWDEAIDRVAPVALRVENESAPLAPAETDAAANRTQVERILAAVVAETIENGVAGMTTDTVAKRASMSLTTFYQHFRTREEAFLAVCDIFYGELRTAIRLAGRPAAEWRPATTSAIQRALAYLGANPDRARIAIVDVLELGADGLERRDRAIDSWSDWLASDPDTARQTTAIAREAAGGAAFTLVYEEIRRGRTAQLGAVAPAVTAAATGFFRPDDRGT